MARSEALSDAPSGSDELLTNESSDRGRVERITKSQRLRLAIMDRWQKSGIGGEFDEYYDRLMDRIIEKVITSNVMEEK